MYSMVGKRVDKQGDRRRADKIFSMRQIVEKAGSGIENCITFMNFERALVG